jgi:hypothetical protein
MRRLLLSLALIALFPATGCSALSTWLSEMAAWRTGAGHTRQEMVDEYNSEAQAVSDMNNGS